LTKETQAGDKANPRWWLALLIIPWIFLAGYFWNLRRKVL
jgi:hypothetical protein